MTRFFDPAAESGDSLTTQYDKARAQAAAIRRDAVAIAQSIRAELLHLNKRARAALRESREDVARALVCEQIDLEAKLIFLADVERDAGTVEHASSRAKIASQDGEQAAEAPLVRLEREWAPPKLNAAARERHIARRLEALKAGI